MKVWAAISSCILGTAVAMGAFGAHGLKEVLDAYYLSIYEKAVFYHFIHGLGMLIIATFPKHDLLSESEIQGINIIFLLGILIFSGSLYLLSITQLKWLGAITPVGGSTFILGWLLLAWKLFRNTKAANPENSAA